jgi:EmrB/QacA subfamily drug resistance transporter
MDQTLSATAARPASRRRGVALVTLCLAVLVAQIDTAVVNLALHPIGAAFGASVAALQWVLDSYNLTYAAFLLTGGLLADLAGRRRVFMAGAAVFTLASLACAFAPTIGVLIAGRIIAGLGAAMIIPASLALIRVVWTDPSERRHVLGIWAACNGLAMAVGPTLGGLLIHQLGWRSIFFLVVPLGTIALILARLAIPESADPDGRHFDLPAQGLGAFALAAVAYSAIEARHAPGLALAALAAALIAGAGFVRVEARRGAAALVPLDLFRIRAFRGAMVATAGMTFAMYGALFLLPVTWQGTDHLGAIAAGLALMPMALVFVAVSPTSGMLTRHLGAGATIGAGLSVLACGLILIAVNTGRSGFLLTELGLGATGFGMGMATGPLMGVAVGAVGAARAGTAAALINVARMIGATIGVAVLGAVYAQARDGATGLRDAMLFGALVVIACAVLAWRTLEGRSPR